MSKEVSSIEFKLVYDSSMGELVWDVVNLDEDKEVLLEDLTCILGKLMLVDYNFKEIIRLSVEEYGLLVDETKGLN